MVGESFSNIWEVFRCKTWEGQEVPNWWMSTNRKFQRHRGLQGLSTRPPHFTNQENEVAQTFLHGSDNILRLLGCLL